MKAHKINQSERFIRGYYIEELSICEEIIKYHKNDPDKTFGNVYTTDGKYYVDKESKDSIDSFLEGDLKQKYLSELQKCVDKYINEYVWCSIGPFWRVNETVNIQYYSPGGGFKVWHNERSCYDRPIVQRHLVFMTYLNDVTEGGETEFYYQNIKLKPEKGLTVIWPPDWTFTHRGIPSLSEEKYIVTGWFSFLER